MAAIGIDLGTTHCCVAVWHGEDHTDEDNGRVDVIINDVGGRITPSWVAFTDTERLIGKPAKDQAYRNAANTVYNAKRLVGRQYSDEIVQADIKGWPFEVLQGSNDRIKIKVQHGGLALELAPEQISAMLLTKLKTAAQDFFNQEGRQLQAVITVPAYFNDNQRAATKEAGELAGLRVLRILNEPTAAALTYGFQSNRPFKSKVLLFDLGGGTCDVAILEVGLGSTQTMAVKGNLHLGGEDLDNRLTTFLLEEIKQKHGIDLSGNARAKRRLQNHAEKAKCTLSTNDTATIDIDSLLGDQDFHCVITRSRFQHLCCDLFEQGMDLVASCLDDCDLQPHLYQIDEIVLVGGCTRIPKVQELLRQIFPGKTLNKRINPDEAVAHGAALQAAILCERRPAQLQKLVVQDITAMSLGIALADGTMSILIPRHTKTPASVTRCNFVIPSDCRGVCIPVYQGEAGLAEGNTFLCDFALMDLPSFRPGSRQVVVTFVIDASGILSVKAKHTGSGKWRQVRLCRRICSQDADDQNHHFDGIEN